MRGAREDQRPCGGVGTSAEREMGRSWGLGGRGEQTSRVAQPASTVHGIDGDATAHDESMVAEPAWARATGWMTSMWPS
jgi:hypothetical protein